jgi:hypothetical protein
MRIRITMKTVDATEVEWREEEAATGGTLATGGGGALLVFS